MLIGEVSEITGLTKKAIRYYEEARLISPKINENNYRQYNLEDVDRLKEISVLRFNGLSIKEIKNIVDRDNKREILDYQINKNLNNINELEIMNKSLENLKISYDIEKEFENQEILIRNMTIKEKLLEAFPLSFTNFYIIHLFDKFLNIKIDKEDEIIAYNNLIDYLDKVEEAPEELSIYMENLVKDNYENVEKTQNNIIRYFEEPDYYESIMKENKEAVNIQIKYYESDEYKSTYNYKMNELMTEYLKKIDLDYIIEFLQIINPEINKYIEDLEKNMDRINEIYKNMDN